MYEFASLAVRETANRFSLSLRYKHSRRRAERDVAERQASEQRFVRMKTAGESEFHWRDDLNTISDDKAQSRFSDPQSALRAHFCASVPVPVDNSAVRPPPLLISVRHLLEMTSNRE